MTNYSKDFNEAFERLSTHEGWGEKGDRYDSQDKGGRHKWGISQRANPDLDFDTLTKDDAKRIFKERYWDAIRADDLPAELRGTAFDAAVNQGTGFARRALMEAGGDVEAFNNMRAERYANIVKRDPSQQRYLNGWTNRLNSYRIPDSQQAPASQLEKDLPGGGGSPPVEQPVAPTSSRGFMYNERFGEWPEQEQYFGQMIGKDLANRQVGKINSYVLDRSPQLVKDFASFLDRNARPSEALSRMVPRNTAFNQPQQMMDEPQLVTFGGAGGLQWGR